MQIQNKNTLQQYIWRWKENKEIKYKKQSNESIIENIRKLFRLKKENEAIKDRIIRDIENLFEKQEDHYKLVRVGDFYSNSYIEYESNGIRNKSLSIK